MPHEMRADAPFVRAGGRHSDQTQHGMGLV
jgi:hypothetical protein